MKKVQINCLSERQGIFYFRRAVPSDLKEKVGKREWKVSLRTSDRRLALVEADAHYEHTERISGGRHSGFLKNHANASARELSKGIRSLNRQIKLHRQKLKDPSKYAKDWASRTDKQKEGLMKKWKTDIARQKYQRDILKDFKTQQSGQTFTGSRIRR